MEFEIADVLRLPIVVLFDAVIAQRIEWIWLYGSFFGFIITFLGASLCPAIFSCEPSVILELYRLLAAVIVHCFVQGWSFATIKVLHGNYYGGANDYNVSMLMKIRDHMWASDLMPPKDLDFVMKATICFAALQILHLIILVLLKERFSPMIILICTSPAWILLFNVPFMTLALVMLVSEIPAIYLFFKKVEVIRPGLNHIRILRRNGNEVIVDDLITLVQHAWISCRVPSVLRLLFIFRCVWGFIILLVERRTFSTSEHDPTSNSGLYYFFHSPAATPHQGQYLEDWDSIEGYFTLEDKERNLTFVESMSAILTDSLISSFSVGAAISVVGHYVGVTLHDFIGGNDLMQGEALGMMSSILFCLLAIQTGLSSLPAWKRIVRLYRNSFLLLSAVLHFFLDVVHPVLMSISPQSHIPLKKHVNPLLVCFLLLIIPSVMCYWLISTKPLSTWMIALTAFNFELIVKVISTLMVYTLYLLDSRSTTNGIVYLDEYVFWIRSISHIIEFVCGLVMFGNGAYILFFESSNLIRAIMMSMHAYVNIYRTFREGVKTLNNRRTVNSKISTLLVVEVDEIEEQDRDVCSICYQDFNHENGEVRKTRCNHMFHFQCLRKWLFIQDTCPMCDRALFPRQDGGDKNQ